VAAPENGASPRAARPILAVLPFENMSGEPGWEYFCDGLTEEVISALCRLEAQRLGVMSRTSAKALRDTGLGVFHPPRDLGLDFFLEGSVRREAGRIRVTASLIRAGDHTLIATEVYETDLGKTFASQESGAERIVRALVKPWLAEAEA
jgi:adenylate cyclase